MSGGENISNRRLLLPYALPYVAYVGIASIPDAWLGRELNYALRIVVTLAALAWSWRRTMSLRGPRSAGGSIAIGAGVGLIGCALWVVMLQSLVGGGGEPWGGSAFWLRVAASTGVVPVFEELLMRGFVLLFLVQWDRARMARARDPLGTALDSSIHALPAGAATPLAVAFASAIFMAGHAVQEWPAAFAYGLLMSALWISRRDLISCVTAHAVTNFALAVYVRTTGAWAIW